MVYKLNSLLKSKLDDLFYNYKKLRKHIDQNGT